MENEQEKIYGIAGLEEITNETSRGYIISNREDGVEYQITVCLSDGDEYVLQNFSENKIFDIPADTTGTIKIEGKKTGSSTIFQVVETRY